MNTTRLPVPDLARVIAVILVTLCHCPVTGSDENMPAALLVRGFHFLGDGVPPLFFLLSGYLGASKINDRTIRMGRYAAGKLRTLAVPFLFWNALLLSLVFLARALGIEALTRSGGAYFDVKSTLSSVASAWLGIGRAPIVYQFWFLRDLIVVSILGIVVCRALARIPLLLLLLLLLAIPVPMARSMGCFLLGYSIKPHGRVLQSLAWQLLLGYCLAWILLGWGISMEWIAVPTLLQHIGSAAFLFCLAALFCRCALGRRLAVLGSASFFVYAAHEPTQTLLAKIWLMRGWPWFGSVFYFLFIPSVVFASCILVYHGLRRSAPGLLPYVTGGR